MKSVQVRAENLKPGDILNGRRIQKVLLGKGRNGVSAGVVTRHPKDRKFEIFNLDGLVRVNRPKKNYEVSKSKIKRVMKPLNKPADKPTETVDKSKDSWRDDFGPIQLEIFDRIESELSNLAFATMGTYGLITAPFCKNGKYSFSGIIVETMYEHGMTTRSLVGDAFFYNGLRTYTTHDMARLLGGGTPLDTLLLKSVGYVRDIESAQEFLDRLKNPALYTKKV